MEQQIRYNDRELSVIKSTFAGNEPLLKELRAYFLQKRDGVELSPASLEVVRKTFLPEIELEAPIYQVIDLYLTLDLKGKSPDEAADAVASRQRIIQYLEERLSRLEGKKVTVKVHFDRLTDTKDKSASAILIDFIARNTLINHIEQCLSQLHILAGKPEESVDETKMRLKKDSAK
jgi:hypothetical protein